jgi:hypothetical protein
MGRATARSLRELWVKERRVLISAVTKARTARKVGSENGSAFLLAITDQPAILVRYPFLDRLISALISASAPIRASAKLAWCFGLRDVIAAQ